MINERGRHIWRQKIAIAPFLPRKMRAPTSGSAEVSVWNHLKELFFLLHPGTVPTISAFASPKGPAVFMIVCSCHVFSDDDVRSAVSSAEQLPRSAKQLYGCLGCSAECGRCARTIKSIIDEALGACAKTCHSGCPHSKAGAHQQIPG
jgi:bacterioferritin-associated ferredoxin